MSQADRILSTKKTPSQEDLRQLDMLSHLKSDVLPLRLKITDHERQQVKHVELFKIDLFCQKCQQPADPKLHKIRHFFSENEAGQEVLVVEQLGLCHSCRILIPGIREYSPDELFTIKETPTTLRGDKGYLISLQDILNTGPLLDFKHQGHPVPSTIEVKEKGVLVFSRLLDTPIETYQQAQDLLFDDDFVLSPGIIYRKKRQKK